MNFIRGYFASYFARRIQLLLFVLSMFVIPVRLVSQQSTAPDRPIETSVGVSASIALTAPAVETLNNSSASIEGSTSDSQTTQNNLPDAPAPQTPPSQRRAPQTKRILGIIPNFRAVSTDEKLPPQTTKEKFATTTQDSFDYSAAVIPTLLAGYSMATDATPEFHQGVAGYSRYFWHTAVDQTTENYFVQFVFPVITHEDSRYYTLGRGGLVKRMGYALSRSVVTRSDSARNVFNVSEVVGAGASAGLSSVYYPTRERSFSNTAQGWGLNVGVDAITFVLKEFWPDVNQSLFHAPTTANAPPDK